MPKAWHHVTLVQSGQRITVYLDGSARPDIDLAVGANLTRGPGRLAIGGRNDGSSAFEGMVGEVAVYDRALAVDEITAHFNSGRSTIRPESSW
jgi:sialidase-1